MNKPENVKNILSIAGSDPSGGAGIQADLKTIAALGGYGMAVITALTAQNTQGVMDVHMPPADFVTAQLDAIFTDIRVDSIKIGMLGDEYIAKAVADSLDRYKPQNIVLDPVMVSTSGHSLLSRPAIEIIQTRIAPQATLITPNIPEGEALLKSSIFNPDQAAKKLSDQLNAPVLLKGGHMKGDSAIDILCANGEISQYKANRIDTNNTHGTGCTLSSAIATNLAQSLPLQDAISNAKRFVYKAIEGASALTVGHGHGPLNHGAVDREVR